MTYLEAREKIMAKLESEGWSVAWNLKVPYAQKNDVRLWFKPQALWASIGESHALGNGRSLFLDTKKLADIPAETLSVGLYKYVKK